MPLYTPLQILFHIKKKKKKGSNNIKLKNQKYRLIKHSSVFPKDTQIIIPVSRNLDHKLLDLQDYVVQYGSC